MRKLTCLFLTVTLLMGILASCNLREGSSDPIDGGIRDNEDGTLDNIEELPSEPATESPSESHDGTPDGETKEGDASENSTQGGQEPTKENSTSKVPESDSVKEDATEPVHETETAGRTEPEETEKAEEPTDKPEEPEDVLESDFVKEYVNMSDNISGQYHEGDDWYLTYSLRLPEISVSYDVDKVVNDAIYRVYIAANDMILQKRAAFDIDYEVYINGDIISILIVKFENNEYSAYTVNIDTAEKKILTLSDLVKICDIDEDKVFDGLKAPAEDLFYLNDDGGLVVFDRRVGEGENVYYLYDRSDESERPLAEAASLIFASSLKDPIYVEIDVPDMKKFIDEAYMIGLRTGYSLARGSEKIVQMSGGDPNYIQVVFETDTEDVFVAVNYYRKSADSEWELVVGNPVTFYEPSKWAS